MVTALQILAAWFVLACATAAAYSAVRTHQKRREREEYQLALAPYQPYVVVEYDRIVVRR